MSQINPFTHAVFQNAELQRRSVVQKQRQLRRVATREKDIPAENDTLEHQVESAEEEARVADEHRNPSNERRKKPAPRADRDKQIAEDDTPHIDLKA